MTCSPKAGGCGTKFYYPPTERSTISYRCSKDGRPFAVTLKRELPTQKFTIERIETSKGADAGSASSETDSYIADAYDFANFYCPCCGYSANPGDTQFVKCSKCRNLVCGGLVYNKLDSAGTTVSWFVCHPDCGNHGPIERRIAEYRATRDAGGVRLAATSAPATSLPAPKAPTSKLIGKG